MSADLIERLREELNGTEGWNPDFAAPSFFTIGNIRFILDALAAKDTALSEMAQQLEQTRIELGETQLVLETTEHNCTAALSEMRAELEQVREDAERWRALMSSQRMHFMGCAGIDLVNKPGTTGRKTADMIPVMKTGTYQHFGMEFWSEHSAFGNPEYPDDFERSLLVAYVDHLRAARAASQDEGEER